MFCFTLRIMNTNNNGVVFMTTTPVQTKSNTKILFSSFNETSSNGLFNDDSRHLYKSCPSVSSFVALEQEQEKLKIKQNNHFKNQKYILENEQELLRSDANSCRKKTQLGLEKMKTILPDISLDFITGIPYSFCSLHKLEY